MNPLAATFDEFQVRYEYPIVPEKIHSGFCYVQIKIHCLASAIDGALQTPQIVMKVLEITVNAFSLFPTLKTPLDIPRQFCKEVKNFTDFFKGFKSVDGLLNLKFSWKIIVLNLSGLTLFILSSLTLIERFKLAHVSDFRMSLESVPVVGILPYGGLLSLAFIGLSGFSALVSMDHKSKLGEKNIYYQAKLLTWSKPLEGSFIMDKQTKCAKKIAHLMPIIASCRNLIEEGQINEQQLDPAIEQQKVKLKACQRALQELTSTLNEHSALLEKYQGRSAQWELLAKKWEMIDPPEIEKFRQAKEDKWAAKLKQVDLEKRANFLSTICQIVIVLKHAVLIASVVSGYGLVLPFIIPIVLEVAGTGGSIANYFVKRSIRHIKISSIDLNHFFPKAGNKEIVT